jgi:uncharacterized protein YjgD (DUF1641 family)
MAIPIDRRPATPASQQNVAGHLERLERARLDHDDAILAAYALLQQLHDHKILELLHGAISAGDVLVTKLALAANSEGSINAARNLISLGRILGSVDPDILHSLADELTGTHAKETDAPPPSALSTLRILFSKDARRGIAGIAAFTQAFGRALATGKRRR